MTRGWKLAVVALAAYALFVSNKLLTFCDDLLELKLDKRMEDLPVWRREYAAPIHAAMWVIAGFVVALLVIELVRVFRRPALSE